MLRIATFNLENLFTRPVAMNQDTDAEGRQALEDHATANRIVAKESYSNSDKNKLLQLTAKYKWHALENTGIERRGSYHPATWEPFDTVRKASEEASDHHLVFADLNIG